MECIDCGSKNLSYSTTTNLYYCGDCHRLFGEDEYVPKQVVEENKEEDLNGFSLMIIHLLQIVPIVNIIITMIVSESNVKYEYRKTFCYKLISQIFISIVALLWIALDIKLDNIDKLMKIHDKFVNVKNIISEFIPDKEDITIGIDNSKYYVNFLDDREDYEVELLE